MRIIAILSTAVFLAGSAFGGPAVSNLVAVQVEGSRTVELTYDVPASNQVLVGLQVYNGDSNLNAAAVSGAIGLMGKGTNQVVTWNAAIDWNEQVGVLTFNLLSEDGLPFHLPYEGGAVAIPRTEQVNSYSTYPGEDGDVRPGLPWPSPRFTDNLDITVTDNMTGLMWARNVSSGTWEAAMNNCANYSLGGHTDWRMPNIREMRSLFSNYSRYNPVLDTSLYSLSGAQNFWTSTAWESSLSTYRYVVNAYYGTAKTLAMRYYNSSNYQWYDNYCLYIPVRGVATGMVQIAKTGQLSQSGNAPGGQDGLLRMGVAWPEPRFTNHGDGTATDHLTGLMWTTNSVASVTWANALSTCASLTTGGYHDWRLPSINELEALVDYGKAVPNPTLPTGHPFGDILNQNNYGHAYWSGTTLPSSSSYAYTVMFYDGRIQDLNKTFPARMLACRGGVEVKEVFDYPTAVAALPETGQTNSWHAGDDGELQAGTEEPSPRFTDYSTINGLQQVLDNKTGLWWLKSLAGYYTWPSAISYGSAFELQGYTDWRVPNIRELESLVAYGESSPALPAGHPFPSYTNETYWSSTTFAGDTASAMTLDLDTGNIGIRIKTDGAFLLFVRGSSTVVAKTGQQVVYQTGDDGTYASGSWGVAVTDRFTDHGNGLVSDKLTGLTWFKDPSQVEPDPVQWWNALDICNAIDFAGFDDWRLPNQNELKSLVDYGRWNDTLPAGHPFENVANQFGGSDYYWSSTTSASDTNQAIVIEYASGGTAPLNKGDIWSGHVWPVRGGNE